ncbi:hypothetical protein J437_LFUL015855 [Ladona fulva]|uniref:Uncharacterized protein n=1 Tax=Ladona fulva TaxID=123851 RepID=A0A8K0KK50_LADFU|nr:hypothetical protein J437_LFUL015855 [Ladona fulva]
MYVVTPIVHFMSLMNFFLGLPLPFIISIFPSIIFSRKLLCLRTFLTNPKFFFTPSLSINSSPLKFPSELHSCFSCLSILFLLTFSKSTSPLLLAETFPSFPMSKFHNRRAMYFIRAYFWLILPESQYHLQT